MVNLFILATAAALQAAPATAAPTAPRTLQTLPGAKIHYYEVAGSTGAGIQRSLRSIQKAQPKTAGQLYTWTVSLGLSNETVGSVCKVASAKAALDANIYLPKLTNEAQVPADQLQRWKAYEAGLEKTALDNLSFVVDRLPSLEQALVGQPCDQAAPLWNKAVQTLIQQQQEFDSKHKPAPAPKESGDDSPPYGR